MDFLWIVILQVRWPWLWMERQTSCQQKKCLHPETDHVFCWAVCWILEKKHCLDVSRSVFFVQTSLCLAMCCIAKFCWGEIFPQKRVAHWTQVILDFCHCFCQVKSIHASTICVFRSEPDPKIVCHYNYYYYCFKVLWVQCRHIHQNFI